jgi:hypothetical protein
MMGDSIVFSTPMGDRALGRDTDATVAHWDAIVASMPTAPRIFAAGAAPRKSPNVRRFHYDAYLDQRSKGYCVGFNACATVMTRLRIPADATETAGDPLPEVILSPLATYDISRLQASAEGINLGNGDGSIGSCAARGLARLGCVDWATHPSPPSAIDSHRNNSPLPAADLAFGKLHLVRAFALAEDWEHGLELNAGGLPLAICSAIPQGMMQTDAKGFFRMRGGVVGGHCYQLIDHDQDQNLAWIGQSWANWGERNADPRYANRGGYTQVGTCPLDELASWFSPRAMANGSSEIICVNTVEGFGPAILSWKEWD